MATHTPHTVRQRQRTRSAKAQQGKAVTCDALDAQGWREDVRWEAWQHGQANQGAPGVEGPSMEAIVVGGHAGERRSSVHEPRRTEPSRCPPVRRGDIPQPTGGTRPLGSAPVAARVVQTAMHLVLAPIFAAAFHPCAYGDRPQREAKM